MENRTAAPEEQEIKFQPGVKGIDQLADPEPVRKADDKEPEDVLEILSPKANVVQWEIGTGDFHRIYTQRPLSFLGKMQWFALVGEVMDKAMTGDDKMSVNSLLSAPTSPTGSLSASDFRDADTFVQAVGKLLVHAPDFLVKSFCIWLAVPDFERRLSSEIMALPPEEGGLTDDQGIEIIETFIDQNYAALDDFFRQKLGRLQTRVQSRQAEQSSRRSKP